MVQLALESAGEVSLGIHDLQGRLIRSLHDGWLPGGLHAFTWDGRDRNGRRAGAGVYFARALAPSGVSVAKLMLSK